MSVSQSEIRIHLWGRFLLGYATGTPENKLLQGDCGFIVGSVDKGKPTQNQKGLVCWDPDWNYSHILSVPVI